MRVVLDTNVLLISIPKTSHYRPIFDAILDGQYTLIISNEILSEYVDILSRHINPSIAVNIQIFLIFRPTSTPSIRKGFNLMSDLSLGYCAIQLF